MTSPYHITESQRTVTVVTFVFVGIKELTLCGRKSCSSIGLQVLNYFHLKLIYLFLISNSKVFVGHDSRSTGLHPNRDRLSSLTTMTPLFRVNRFYGCNPSDFRKINKTVMEVFPSNQKQYHQTKSRSISENSENFLCLCGAEEKPNTLTTLIR